jgi:drug/metabolite transporter (DMT)-like permease
MKTQQYLFMRFTVQYAVIAGFCLLVIFWGLFPIAMKLGVQDAPPFFLSSLRLAVATCVMTTMPRWKAGSARKLTRLTWRNHRHMFCIGVFMAGVPTGIFALAAQHAPAGTLSVLWATLPIFTALFAPRNAHEVRGWRLVASMLMGAIGVLIVLTGYFPFLSGPHTISNINFSLVWNNLASMSELLVLGSAILSALAIHMARRCMAEIPITQLTTWQVFYGCLFLILMSLIFERNQWSHMTWRALGIVFYAGIICGCGCNLLTFWLVRRIGAVRTAYSDFIVPAVTLVLSHFLLGESITLVKLGGLVLVLLGAAIIARGRTVTSEAPAASKPATYEAVPVYAESKRSERAAS